MPVEQGSFSRAIPTGSSIVSGTSKRPGSPAVPPTGAIDTCNSARPTAQPRNHPVQSCFSMSGSLLGCLAPAITPAFANPAGGRLAGIIHGHRELVSYVGQVSQPAVFQAGWETCPTLMNNPG